MFLFILICLLAVKSVVSEINIASPFFLNFKSDIYSLSKFSVFNITVLLTIVIIAGT